MMSPGRGRARVVADRAVRYSQEFAGDGSALAGNAGKRRDGGVAVSSNNRQKRHRIYLHVGADAACFLQENAKGDVAGRTVGNDVSGREWRIEHGGS